MRARLSVVSVSTMPRSTATAKPIRGSRRSCAAGPRSIACRSTLKRAKKSQSDMPRPPASQHAASRAGSTLAPAKDQGRVTACRKPQHADPVGVDMGVSLRVAGDLIQHGRDIPWLFPDAHRVSGRGIARSAARIRPCHPGIKELSSFPRQSPAGEHPHAPWHKPASRSAGCPRVWTRAD